MVVDEAGSDGRDREAQARHEPYARVVATGILDAVDGECVGEWGEGRLGRREGDEADGDHDRRHRQEGDRQGQPAPDGRDLQGTWSAKHHVGDMAPGRDGCSEGEGREGGHDADADDVEATPEEDDGDEGIDDPDRPADREEEGAEGVHPRPGQPRLGRT